MESRRNLRELMEASDEVYARIFGTDGTSEMMKIDKSILGIDGMFGEYVKEGGKIVILGKTKDKLLVGSVTLV